MTVQMTVAQELAAQANAAAAEEAEEFERMVAAQNEARMRQTFAETQGSPLVRPAWLQAAAELAGAPVTPEDAARRAEQAKRIEDEAAKVERQRQRARVETAVGSLPALYSYPLGADELDRFVGRKEAILETRRALASKAPGIVWVGTSGSGKTTLACAAARAWAEQHGGGRIVFARATEIATASRYHALGAGQPDAIVRAIKADLLILDELGAQTRAAQWTDVEDVVFARYEQNRPTWITTWLVPNKDVQHPPMSVAESAACAVSENYGDGFARRVFERAWVVDCGGR